MISLLLFVLHPLIDAYYASLPFHYRCRMLLLLPFTFISYTWKSLPYRVNRPFVVYHIPTRRPGETVRALIYNHPNTGQRAPVKRLSREERLRERQDELIRAEISNRLSFTPQRAPVERLRPLHVDIHGGGFIGGIPEYDAPFCTQVAKTTGAVVVSLTYRFAPRYPYPAAHDDVEDAILWLVDNAEELFGADPEFLTLSGSSVGGTLALGAALNVMKIEGYDWIKGIVTFYSPVDLRLPPQDKRKPPGFPSIDLSWPLFPLFDAYAGLGRVHNNEDPRLHPTLIPSQDWPADTLFVIPTRDILLYEQLELVERLQKDYEISDRDRKATSHTKQIEKLMFEGQWHGWLDLPSWAIDESTRQKAFTAACDFLTETHRKNGFFGSWPKSDGFTQLLMVSNGISSFTEDIDDI